MPDEDGSAVSGGLRLKAVTAWSACVHGCAKTQKVGAFSFGHMMLQAMRIAVALAVLSVVALEVDAVAVLLVLRGYH